MNAQDPSHQAESTMTGGPSSSDQSASDSRRSAQAFADHEAVIDETGYRASMELERVRREHGADAVHDAAYALIVTAVGHFATERGVLTAQRVLQVLADNLGENISPRSRLDS